MRVLKNSDVRSATELSIWGDYIRESIAEFRITELQRQPFSGQLSEKDLGCGKALYAKATPHRVEKPGAGSAPFMLLRYQIEGQTDYSIGDRRLCVKSGEAIMLDPRKPLSMVFPQYFRTLTLKIQRAIFEERAPNLLACADEPFLKRLPIAPLLVEYLRCFSEPNEIDIAVRETMLMSFLDLLDACYQAKPAQQLAKHERLRRDIDAYLSFNFSNHGLSAQSVAKAMSVSVRLLQLVYQEDAMTFGRTLMEKRLHYARSLIQTRSVPRMIDVAYSSGFNDLSYFNRCYKRAFGETPGLSKRCDRQKVDS